MKSLSMKLAKIVGTPTLKNWSQVYTFFPEDEVKRKQRGTLLAVLFFSFSSSTEETTATGREILLRLHEEYYGQTQEPVLERLTKTIEKVCQEFSTEEQRLEIVAAVQLENILYLASFGAGEVWLKRGGALGKVLEGREKEGQNASGFVEEEDLIVLGTAFFFQTLGEGVFRAALENNQPDEAVEFLTPLIHSGEAASGAAALIGKVESAQELTPEEDKGEVVPAEDISKEKPTGSFTRFVAKVRGKLPQLSLGAIYVRRTDEEKKNRRTFFIVAIILISLLAVSLFFGAKKRNQNSKYQQFTQAYSETLELLNEGKALVVLNPLQSRELLFQAKAKLAEIEKLEVETLKTEELKGQIEAVLGQVYKEYQLSEVPIFTDLTLVTAEGRGDSLALSQGSLAVLDRSKNRILTIDTARKSAEVLVGGGAIEAASSLAISEEKVFVLEKEGVAEIEIKSKKMERGKIETDEGWGEIGAIKAYAGNLYLLDKGKSQIWRYTAGDDGFGARQSWFGKSTPPNLQDTISMTIDGSIWLLSDEGKILKFIQGAPAVFGLSGLAKAFSDPLVIYTDNEAQFLYILDKGNGRVVVLAKSGDYQAEYIWPASPQGGEGIKDVSDMVVSEAEGKIFLLAGSKVYEINLR